MAHTRMFLVNAPSAQQTQYFSIQRYTAKRGAYSYNCVQICDADNKLEHCQKLITSSLFRTLMKFHRDHPPSAHRQTDRQTDRHIDRKYLKIIYIAITWFKAIGGTTNTSGFTVCL